MVESVIVISHDIEDSSEANLSRRLWGNIRIVKLHKYLLFLEKNSNLYNHVMAQILFSKNSKRIADVLESGTPPGIKVVKDSWDSAIICPVFYCLDVDLTKLEVKALIRQEMTSFSALDSINTYFGIAVSALPLSSQDNLSVSGRCYVSSDELPNLIRWTPGYDEALLEEKLFPDDEDSGK